jgi:hypothetical protein
VFHRKTHTVSFRETAIWSAVWVVLDLAFSSALYHYSNWQFDSDCDSDCNPDSDADSEAR